MSTRKPNFKNKVVLYLPLICIALAFVLFGADSRTSILGLSSLIFIGAGFLALHTYYRGRYKPLFLQDLLLLLMVFSAAVITTIAIARGLYRSYEHEYLLLFLLIVIFWLGRETGESRQGFGLAVKGIVGLAGLFSIFAMFQHIFMPGYNMGFEKPYHENRLTGTFLSANTAATVFGVFVFFSLSNLYKNWMNWPSGKALIVRVGPSLVVSILCFACLLMTESAAGIAMFGLTCVGMITCAYMYRFAVGSGRRSSERHKNNAPEVTSHGTDFFSLKRLVLVWGSVLTAGSLVFCLILFDVFPLNHPSVQTSFSDRRHLYSVLWQAFLDAPFTGHGIGRIDPAKLKHVTIESNYTVSGQHAAHNIVLQWLVQTGLIFTLIMSAIFAFIFFYILSGLRHMRRYWWHLLALIASITYITLHSFFDYALEVPAVAMLAAWMLGLGFGYVKKDENQNSVWVGIAR